MQCMVALAGWTGEKPRRRRDQAFGACQTQARRAALRQQRTHLLLLDDDDNLGRGDVRCKNHQRIKVQPVRTTIDLPADLHTIAGQLAHNQRMTLSQVVADLMRRALNSPAQAQVASNIVYHPVTGFPTMRLGSGPITTEMVRQMQDDE